MEYAGQKNRWKKIKYMYKTQALPLKFWFRILVPIFPVCPGKYKYM